jgi:FkbM family methyltransferase
MSVSAPNQFPQRFFSQHGEDYLLDQMFRDQLAGTFVEIGCIDGRRFSNTLVLEQRGWRGMCVEAHAAYIDLLRRNRPNSTVVHCAVGACDGGEVTFYANSRGSLSTLDPSREEDFRARYSTNFTGFEPQQVKLRGISSLLQEHGVEKVDVLSLDIEGCEVPALRSIDYHRHRPRVLIVECDSPEQEREIDEILLPAGYIKGFRLEANLFYCTERRLIAAVAGRGHAVTLTHTQHPLDHDGDRNVPVNINLPIVQIPQHADPGSVHALGDQPDALPSADAIIRHGADRAFPFLVSFPRTGSHWLRMVLEMYFDRPLLTRSFFEHANEDYLLYHSHDLDSNLVRDDVLYLYRDPVDTVYSQLQYHREDINDPQRVAYWADLYGQHAHKWLCSERFTRRKTVLCYDDLRSDPETDFAAAIRHLGGEVDHDRLRMCLAAVDRNRVKERTAHDEGVVNLHNDYARQREQFRASHAAVIWNAFLQGRDTLAARFGYPPVAVPADHTPAKHPPQPWEYRKIIGLVPGKNEARHIEFCIRALAQVCDSIVYFDDDSSDDSLAIVESIAQECRVEHIIRKRNGEFHETIRRALPLAAGRELGGTHFVVIDADEAFTANLTQADLLRRRILALEPGDVLELAWIQLWRSVAQYRHDASVWTNNYKAFVFADDGTSCYDETFIHLERVPSGLGGKRHRIPGYEYGLMHFQFVNWRNLLVKQAWYRCLERIHDPSKPARTINELYAPSKDERDLGLREVPNSWFAAYPFFDEERLQQTDAWREQQVLDWFKDYGESHFADLDIWDVDWGAGLGHDPVAGPAVLVDNLIADGERRFAVGDNAGARHCFERALRQVPGHAVALNNLAVLCWESGDAGQALLHLAQALEADPDNREVVFNSVQMLDATGHTTDAAALCRSYLDDHPRDEELRTWQQNRDLGTTAGTAQVQEIVAPATGPYEFSNDWFAVHRDAWQQYLLPWASRFASLDILEIGSYEGASACWILDNLVTTEQSRLVCIDAWTPNPAKKNWELDMEVVFQRFERNLRRTGKAGQVSVLRGNSRELLPELPAQSFHLIYVDGDHSEEGVFRDTLQAFRLLRPGGMVLWDDYFWSEGETVKRGVDRACAELGIQPRQLGQNMAYEKPAERVDAATLTQEGERLFAAGDLAGARACFERALVADGHDPVVHNNLAVLSWEEGDTARALQHLARALDVGPDCRDAVLNGARMLAALEQTADALALCDTWLGVQPDDDELRLLAKSLRGDTTVSECRPAQAAPVKNEPYWVSAIVSTYNGERFLRGCLEDLEAQTIADRLEIIVVDSGSTQNERAIVENFQRRYDNIRYLRTERESLYAAWNRGVGLARGRYLTNANTDDRHRHDALEVMARTLDEHPEAGLVYGDCLITRTPNETYASNSADRLLCWPEFSLRQALQYCLFGPQPMWRRSAHAEIGSFSPDYKVAGDYDFFLRLATRYGALHIAEPLGLYYEGGGLELGDPGRAQAETTQMLHHARRNTALEHIYPALRQMHGDATARAAALADFARSMFSGLYPDRELAGQCMRAAQQLCPQPPLQHPVLTTLPGLVPPEQNRQPWRNPLPSGRRKPGFSFCVISGGRRPDKLQRLINSIHALHVPQYEIIVAGTATLGDDVRYEDLPEAARVGRTSVMRNAAAAASCYDRIVFCDDDILFTRGWLAKIERALDDHDVAVGRLLNSDGTRHWDWATVGGPRGHIMLDYGEADSHLYLTSGLLALRAAVWEANPWDEQRGYRQDEDVEFSQRLLCRGLRLCCCSESVAIHDDDHYTQVGRVVLTRSAAGLQRWRERGWARCTLSQMIQAAKECLHAGEPADAADWLRYSLHVDPNHASARSLWDSLVRRYGGPVDGFAWLPEAVEALGAETEVQCGRERREPMASSI